VSPQPGFLLEPIIDDRELDANASTGDLLGRRGARASGREAAAAIWSDGLRGTAETDAAILPEVLSFR
jgi:hypothetical protein